jgi:ubiquinone/menaquinone biosynthesis C-methylase UbiE
MDRRAWLDEQRASVEERYDQIHAATYDEGQMSPTHRRFVERVIGSCPPARVILDAPCGTGRYFEMVLAAGRRIVGVDQSAGMLARARAKHSGVALEKGGLQELDFEAEFDAAMCIDAMEHVSPEDWPLVLGNFRRAVRGSGLIYLTVEHIDWAEVATAFTKAKAEGLPVVEGEKIWPGSGYHYYPTPDRVKAWLDAEGLEVIDEARSSARIHGYLHLLVRKRHSP